VIVDKLDRFARNRRDDANLVFELRLAGTQLVSVKENIDDTPSGKLLQGIMASIAEFYSANLATEIVKGATQKAQAGGTPYQAPIGYLKVRELVDGREIRTVVPDPQRAPLVAYAFEVSATGEYTLHTLLDELTDLGLTNRAAGSRPERPLHLSKLAKMLRNPYYIGIVTYKGVQYPGRHQPLVPPALFERVQAVLDAHNTADERHRVHHHYLKGSVFCARCGSRLSITHAKGKSGGIYPYFFCMTRHRGQGCDLPFLPVAAVEAAVCAFYNRVQLEPERVATLRQQLLAELEHERQQAATVATRQQARIATLERDRRRIADCALAGSVPQDIAAEKQAQIRRELANAREQLAATQLAHTDIETTLTQALDLVRDCQAAYRQADPELRREWNQALFARLQIDTDRVTAAELTPPFAALLAEDLTRHIEATNTNEPLLAGVGLNKTLWVELRGIEPNKRILPSVTPLCLRRIRTHVQENVGRHAGQFSGAGTAFWASPTSPISGIML